MCFLSMCDLLTCLSDCLSHSSQYCAKEEEYEATIAELKKKIMEVRTLVTFITGPTVCNCWSFTQALLTGLHH